MLGQARDFDPEIGGAVAIDIAAETTGDEPEFARLARKSSVRNEAKHLIAAAHDVRVEAQEVDGVPRRVEVPDAIAVGSEGAIEGEHVGPCPAVQHVQAAAAREDVVSGTARQRVGAAPAKQIVPSGRPRDVVVPAERPVDGGRGQRLRIG